jgi:hypothetical protein
LQFFPMLERGWRGLGRAIAQATTTVQALMIFLSVREFEPESMADCRISGFPFSSLELP